MSIFDPGSSLNPAAWINEKTLLALKATAQIVDLANEPDTTRWYRKRLKALATPVIARLVPMAALVYDAGQDAAHFRHVTAIVEGGTEACNAWCKAHGIIDPDGSAFAELEDEDDGYEKGAAGPETIRRLEEDTELRLDVYAGMSTALLRSPPSREGSLLLLWLLCELRLSPYADIAVVSRRFLPTDVGITPVETLAAYRELHERGLVERVDGIPNLGAEAIALRLVVSDRNGSKHPPPFREEAFGYPGARIGGKPTVGNLFVLCTEEPLASLARERLSQASLHVLRELLQHDIGVDRIHVESLETRDDDRGFALVVRLRHARGDVDAAIRKLLGSVVEGFVRRPMGMPS